MKARFPTVGSLPLLVLLALPVSLGGDAGLVAHWQFTEAAQSRDGFVDQAGARPLVAADPGFPPRFVDGERSLLLTAEDGPYLVGTATPAELPERRLTLEAWVAPGEPRPWAGIVGAFQDNDDFERGFLLGLKNNRFVFGLATEKHPTLEYLAASEAFIPNRWYHVAGTYDGKVQRIYVDGELAGESKDPGGDILYDEEQLFVVGSYKDDNEDFRFVGALDEIRVFERALSRRDLLKRAKDGREQLPELETGSSDVPTLAALQPAIHAAIDRGVEHLLKRQYRDGSFGHRIGDYRNGMTSLALLTLLKCGVPQDHPSVRKALAFLELRDPDKTYSTGLQLMALAATGDRQYKAWAARLAQLLLDWESANHAGSWGYPHGVVDLSNNQFAALGLWSARSLGVSVPRDVWTRLAEAVLDDYRGESTQVEAAGGRYKERRATGFRYRRKKEETTGSMTAAGLCILALAQESAGRKLGKVGARIDPAVNEGLAWLDTYWSVDSNPGHGQYAYYYLYALERVGALFELDRIGNHDWYREGAEFLIKDQVEGGSWGQPHQTCFALLFLSRATATVSGRRSAREPSAWSQAEGPVRLQVAGGAELVFWIDGFDNALLEHFAKQPKDRRGLRIDRVEYLLDDEVVATVPGKPAKRWKAERFAARVRVEEPGRKAARARVWVVPEELTSKLFSSEQAEAIDSYPLEVNAVSTPGEFQEAHAGWFTRNLAAQAAHEVQVSSSYDATHNAARVCDGYQASAWVAAAHDQEPSVSITFLKPVRADTVVLSPANSRLVDYAKFDAPRRIRLSVNDDTYELELPRDGLTALRYDLPRSVPVRRLEVRVLERERGTRFPGAVGWSEIGLEGGD